MNDENKKLEKIRDLLSKYTPHFCLIYRGKESTAGLELKWCKAASSDKKTQEEYDKLAANYQEIALNSYKHRRNFVIKEASRNADSRGQLWCGFFVHAEPNEGLPPKNSLGQSWWQLVVGFGATREDGYVIIARIAAKEAKEVHECIAQIEAMWQDDFN